MADDVHSLVEHAADVCAELAGRMFPTDRDEAALASFKPHRPVQLSPARDVLRRIRAPTRHPPVPADPWCSTSPSEPSMHGKAATGSSTPVGLERHRWLRGLRGPGTLNPDSRRPPTSDRSSRGRQHEQGPARLARRRRDLHDHGGRRANGRRRVLRHRRRARTRRDGGHCGVREIRRSKPSRASGTQSPDRGAGPGPGVNGADVQAGQTPSRRGQRLECQRQAAMCSPSLSAPWSPHVSTFATQAHRGTQYRARAAPAALDVAGARTIIHPHSAGYGTSVAGRRWGDLPDSSLARRNALSRAEIDSHRARVPYTAGCEFFPCDKAARECAPVEFAALPGCLRPLLAYSLWPRTTTPKRVPVLASDKIHRHLPRPINHVNSHRIGNCGSVHWRLVSPLHPHQARVSVAPEHRTSEDGFPT